MSFALSPDNKTSEYMRNLAPHKNVFELRKPHHMSSAATFPKPVATTISNWVHSNRRKPLDPNKTSYLHKLAAMSA